MNDHPFYEISEWDGSVPSFSIGDFVKLRFEGYSPQTDETEAEGMWVKVTDAGDEPKGTLANDPAWLPMEFGDVVFFSRSQVRRVEVSHVKS